MSLNSLNYRNKPFIINLIEIKKCHVTVMSHNLQCNRVTKGAFQKSELAGQTNHFDNEIGFFQEFLLKTHLLRA